MTRRPEEVPVEHEALDDRSPRVGFTADPDEILELDESRVIARGRYGGEGVNGPLDVPFIHTWTLRDGVIVRFEQLADTRKFCDAVGK